MAQTVKRLSRAQETQVRSLGQEDPLEKEWQSTPVLLPEKSHGQRSLVGYSPWGHKESDMTERLHFLSATFPRNFIEIGINNSNKHLYRPHQKWQIE